jgi:cell division septal protein FtsQ
MPALDLTALRAAVARVPRLPRWIAGGIALAIVVGALVVGTARSSVFAIRRISVSGASARQAAIVERALHPLLGRSLSSLSPDQVLGRLRALPIVSAAAYDRAFPHTLRVYVRAEEPVAVVRRGSRAWLVSAHARVLGTVAAHVRAALPRIWLPAATVVRTGRPLRASRDGVAVVAPLAGTRFLHQVRSVTVGAGEVTVELRSGTELRLGEPRAVPLKLAIAKRIAPTLPADGKRHYLDLTVPDRPVAGVLTSLKS